MGDGPLSNLDGQAPSGYIIPRDLLRENPCPLFAPDKAKLLVTWYLQYGNHGYFTIQSQFFQDSLPLFQTGYKN